ncbi:sugar transferase [Candidatus Sulfidibacterium hydrothermale]|uniref:sugar transferase n=1 Tax=Candidatus Sulfidibacterium hydrothermale TaxID=2875962 RepID=UPI00293D6EF4|nr:sugar transferase [Candidatus Sulfidibacterium hydrothermale]
MGAETKKKLKLLYMGNRAEVIDALKKQSAEAELVVMENGLRGIDYLRKNKDIDAILSDHKLPGIEGSELAKHIKAELGLSKTPFILFAFGEDANYRQKMLKEKAVIDDLYLSMPPAEQLFTRIRFLQYYLSELRETAPAELDVRKEYKIPFVKRLFDIIVSATALLILSPLMILVAIAIKLESKGPVIYKSKRVGTGYRIFDFLKFRSMYTGADAKLKELEHLNQYAKEKGNDEESQDFPPCPRCAKLPEGEYCSPVLYIEGKKICEYWYRELKKKEKGATFVKIENDPRITKVGKIIRNTSIDELPQLINVLKGDMSIVGNRPLPLYEAEQLTSDDWSARFLAPAGITGLWQVELRGKGGVMSEEERKALDNQYAYNYSFWGDIKLILRTIPALFQKETV